MPSAKSKTLFPTSPRFLPSDAVNRALLSARDTATFANERYRTCLSNYLDVVDAQRVALQAERRKSNSAASAPSPPSSSQRPSGADGNTVKGQSPNLAANHFIMRQYWRPNPTGATERRLFV
jgi:hypothetical protein